MTSQRKQQILAMVLIIILAAILFVVWYNFFRKEVQIKEQPSAFTKEINIDFSVLESSILEGLDFFESIIPLQGEPGRQNPFLKY